jgi:hypothetical protein
MTIDRVRRTFLRLRSSCIAEPKGLKRMKQPAPIIEFRITPEYRRCCYYVLIAMPVFIVMAYCMSQIAMGRLIDFFNYCCVIFLGLASAMVVPLRWKLCLDQQGLKRRRLFLWDSWTWDDIASGRLRKLHEWRLLDPDRPWWRRQLNLEFMARDDIQIVFNALNAHYRLPKAPDLPDVLKIKYRFRHSVTFDREAIHLRIRGLEKAYCWPDVQNVSVVRMDTLRRNFRSLQIVLPDEEIDLQNGAVPSWHGATSGVINEYLNRHVPPEKISVAVAGHEIPSRSQIERTLKELEKTNREMRTLMPVLFILIIGFLVWMWITADSIFAPLTMGGIMSLYVPIFVALHLRARAQVKELKNQLNSLANGKDAS